MISDVEHLFMYLLAICMSSLDVYSYPFLILKSDSVLLLLNCMNLYIFWMLTPYQIYDLQMFSPILQAAFSFCWLFLLLGRIFLF